MKRLADPLIFLFVIDVPTENKIIKIKDAFPIREDFIIGIRCGSSSLNFV